MDDETATAEAQKPGPPTLAEMTTGIAAAYIAHNSVPVGDVPALLQSVHAALAGLRQPEPAPAAPDKLTPPVPIRKTVTDGHIISLEDGRRYQTLKKHLAKRGLTPDAYRRKWGLPFDYPMVAPAYSKARSALAKETGLGNVRRKGTRLPAEAI